ncbi:MAG: hypothetical protein JWO13_3784 [Acidobacteriales bacterium]|nr:hypothetical protein [Terriglobales bacterium]
MHFPPQSGVVWLSRVAVLLACVGGCVRGASAQQQGSQEQTSQRQRNAPASEVSAARLEDKYPQIEVRRALPQPPSVRYPALQKSAPARIVLPRLDAQPYIEEDERQSKNGERRIRGGVMREVKMSPAKDGEWIEVEPGTKVWRLEIQSPGAHGLRLHLANVGLASGSQLFIYEGENKGNAEMFTVPNVPRTKEIFSSPTIAETVTVELVQKIGEQAPADTFDIVGVGHLYRGSNDPSTIVPAGACNLDASCYPDWDHTGDSVGRTDYISGQFIYYCSGALINNNSGDFSPMFLTAAHCGIDSTTAASVHILWKYKTNACNGQEMFGSSSSGARFLATSAGSDSTLLEITGSLPQGLTWAGWSIGAPPVGSAITGIHHPETSYRRISFGNTLSDDPSFAQYHQVRFSGGTTEPGSSGSPLFNDQHLIIGELWGGTASCTNPSGSAYYGKLSVSYPHFVDAQGNNYLEKGLPDDRFGDITSRENAPLIQSGTLDNLILRYNHDDWFRLGALQDRYRVTFRFVPFQQYIGAEIYRNQEPTPLLTNTNVYDLPTFVVPPGNDTYYVRFFLRGVINRQLYGIQYALDLPLPPFVTYRTASQPTSVNDYFYGGILQSNGSTGTYWFEYSPGRDLTNMQVSPHQPYDANPIGVLISYVPPEPFQENSDYTFRVVASDGTNTVRSNAITFHTISGSLLVSSASVDFPDTRIGTTSSSMVTLTNTSHASGLIFYSPLNYPYSPFASTADCPTTLPPDSSCHFTVTFTPQFPSRMNGGFSIQTSAGNTNVLVSGAGFGAQTNFSVYSADFPHVLVGTNSAMMVTLFSTGTEGLNTAGIGLSAPFSETNDCPAVLAPGASCHLWVTVTPNVAGETRAMMYVVPGTFPLRLYLQAFDIQLNNPRPSRSHRGTENAISPGKSAAYHVQVVPSVPLNATATIACGGLPAGVSCQVQPSIVNLSGGPVDVNVIVSAEKSAGQQGRAIRLRGRGPQEQKSFDVTVNASVGNAVRSLKIPVTLTQ